MASQAVSGSRLAEQKASIFGVRGAASSQADEEADRKSKIMKKVPDTLMERLISCLDEATSISKGLDGCLIENTSKESKECSLLANLVEGTDWDSLYSEGKTMFRFSKNWTTDIVEGKTLQMLCEMQQAKTVLEIGMFVGYAALSMAEVHSVTKVTTLEIDPFLEKLILPIVNQSPVGHKIDIRINPALTSLNKAIEAEEKFDFIFVDADKGNYIKYYEAALQLLAPHGTLVFDNTLFKGQAFFQEDAQQFQSTDPFYWNDGGQALKEFNICTTNDPRTKQVMLPIRDGITIFRKAEVDIPQSSAKPNSPAKYTPTLSPTRTTPTTGARILDRLRLDGKTAMVTGGGQGIGRALAIALVEAGVCGICIADYNEKTAHTVVEEIKQLYHEVDAFAIKADVTKEEDCHAIMLACVERWDKLDVAVNNAGINKNAAAEDTKITDWDSTFAVNTRGLFLCCQAEAKHMLPRGYGKIINIASMATLLVPHPQKQVAYNASKAAVVKITQTLACEWIDRGINVNAISPGIVNTPLIQNSPDLKPLVSTWLDQIPAKRLAEVSDLQAAVVYLASDASSYMVGQNMAICGGQDIW